MNIYNISYKYISLYWMYLIILIAWFQRTNVKAIFLEESSQDAKGVIRNCNLRKDRQYNGQKKTKEKQFDNGRQNTTRKTKYQARRTH